MADLKTAAYGYGGGRAHIAVPGACVIIVLLFVDGGFCNLLQVPFVAKFGVSW